MVYKKYIKRDGRTYGPYFYKSIKKDGKVITEYIGHSYEKKTESKISDFHGKVKKSSRNFWIFAGFLSLVCIALLVYILFPFGATGKALAEIQETYYSGEQITGQVNLILKQGELFPASSKIVVDNAGEIGEFNLYDLVSNSSVNGNFYIENKNISGFGDGYGVQGEKEVYPLVSFTFKIISNIEIPEQNVTPEETGNESIEQNVSGTEIPTTPETPVTPSTEIPVIENPTIPPTTETPTPEAPIIPPTETPTTENPVTPSTETPVTETPTTSESSPAPSALSEDSSTSSESSSVDSGGITGAVIDEELIQGEVSKDSPFKYNLNEGESIEIVKSSQKVNFDIQNNKAIFTTDYSEIEKGFGKDYIKNERVYIPVNLSSLGIIAKEGKLKISFVYQDVVITSSEKEIKLKDFNETLLNMTNITILNETTNYTLQTSVKQFDAVLGKPVKWNINIKPNKKDILKIKIPREAENVDLVVIDETALEDVQPSVEVFGETNPQEPIINETNITNASESSIPFSISGQAIDETTKISGKIKPVFDLKVEDEFKQVNLDAQFKEYSIEYETPAPYLEEEQILQGKRVRVFGPESVHYQDVLVFTNLSENLSIQDTGSVTIFWVEKNVFVPVQDIQDTDSNGIYDYIEWVVPSLSNQTFEIIVIIKAEHLDSERNFISNIYEEVKFLDDIWSETISSGDYVRVTFERNLTSSNDITLYLRIVNGTPKIEVYEKNKTEIVAEFDSVTPYEYNKVLLTNLQESQDTFDLRVVDGYVEFDYIVDPNTAPTQETPIFSPTYPLTTQNFTCYNQSTYDADGNSVTNIYNWLVDGTSIAVLNLPFDTNVTSPASAAIKDYSGQNNNATLGLDPATPMWISSGKVGGAYNFVNDVIRMPTSGFTVGYSNLTVMAWIYRTGVDSWQRIAVKGCFSGGYSGSWFFLFDNANHIYVTLNNGSWIISPATTATISNSNWYHVAFTFDGENIKIYIDGTNYSSTSAKGTIQQSGDYNLGIGADGCVSSVQNPFVGRIDEVKIYNKSLSRLQISRIYQDEVNGLSVNSTIVASETSVSQNWTCQITPNDAIDDGLLSQNSIIINGVFLLTPLDNSSFLPDSVSSFSCSAFSSYSLVNISLWGNWSGGWHKNQTVSISGASNSTTFNVSGIPLGAYNWNCQAYNINNNGLFSPNNRTFTVVPCYPPTQGDWNIIQNCNINNYVQTIPVSGKTRVFPGGSLTIDNSFVVLNETIVDAGSSMVVRNSPNTIWQNGNLTINGNYSLMNSTLRMNGTASNNGSIGILVNGTGRMDIFNGSNITNGQDLGYRYFFRVNSGSNFSMNYSFLSYAGWATGIGNRGLELKTQVNNFRGNTLSNNQNGLTLYSDNNHIENNTIRDSRGYGIICDMADSGMEIDSFNQSIIGNEITGNLNGIYLGSLNITIDSNNISNNLGNGISIYKYMAYLENIKIFNNVIQNNNGVGIGRSGTFGSLGFYGAVIFGNRIINNQLGGFDLQDFSSNNLMVDNLIVNNTPYDISVSSDSPNNTFLNTIFNKSKVFFEGTSPITSYMLVQWYLDVNVGEEGVNILGANVSAYNKSGVLTFSQSTQPNGSITRQNVIEYMQNYTGPYYQTNYTINVTNTGFENVSLQLNITNSTFLPIIVGNIPPKINFVSSTEVNNTFLNRRWTFFNVSINESNLKEAAFNWNGTNYSVYDPSLILMMNFDKRSAIGEYLGYVADLSGNGNYGIVGGALSWNATGGRYNGAYQFNGSGSGNWINISKSSSLNNTNALTVAAWIKPLNSIFNNMIFTNDNNGAIGSGDLWLYLISSKIFAYIDNSNQQLTSLNLVPDNNWSYITLTANSSHMVLYLNGEQESVALLSDDGPPFINSSANFYIGSAYLNSYPFNGTIDELRVYNRALNASEVQELYYSNLYKSSPNMWVLGVNQSVTQAGTYTYYSYARDVINFNKTETRTITLDPCSPSPSADWNISETCVLTNKQINMTPNKNINILSGGNLILDNSTLMMNGTGVITVFSGGVMNLTNNATLVAGKTNIQNGGLFYAKNSKNTIWQNDNLTISGNYTLDNSTLRMNGTTVNGSVGINVTSTGKFMIKNNSLVTHGNNAGYKYAFITSIASYLFIVNSTVEYSGWNYSTGQKGLEISGSSNISSSTFRNNYNGLVLLSNGNILDRVNTSYNSNSGIDVLSKYNLIKGSFAERNANNGVHFNYSSGLYGSDNIIQNSTVRFNLGYGISTSSNVGNITIENNSVFSNGNYGILILTSHGSKIKNNYAANNTVSEMMSQTSDNVVISSNFVNSSGAVGIWIIGGLNISLINNTAFGNSGSPICFYLYNTNDQIFYNNTFYNCSRGVYIKKSNNNTLINFNLSYNSNQIYYDSTESSVNLNNTFVDSVFSGSINSEVLFYHTTSAPVYNLSLLFLNVSFNKSKISFQSCSGNDRLCQLNVKWYLDVNVTNKTGPLPGANVQAFNRTGQSTFLESTQLNGLIPRQNVTEYMQNYTGIYPWTNYTINASKVMYGPYSGQANITNNMQLNIVMNGLPVVSNVILNSSSGFNLSTDNLSVYYSKSDPDNDIVSVITNWYTNSSSITVLNLPFNTEVNGNGLLVKDYSSFGNVATLGNSTYGTASIWNASGKVGGAYQFDGVNDFITCGNNSVLNINSSMTIEVWIKPAMSHETHPIINNSGVIAKAANPGWSWQLRFGNPSVGRRLGFQFNNGSVPGVWVNVNESLVTGQWYHVVGTYDSDEAKVANLAIYLNGVKRDQNTIQTYYDNTSVPILIGNEGWPGNFFNGTIDEVRIYNRSLSPEQIYENYLAGLAGKSVEKIVDQETSMGDIWQVLLVPNDAKNDGADYLSNSLTLTNSLPNTTNIILNSTFGGNKTLEDIQCYVNISDGDNAMVYANYSWYNNTVLFFSGRTGPFPRNNLTLISVLGNGNTTKGQNWNCSVKAYDGELYEDHWNNATLKILNSPPVVNITAPEDNNYTYNRTPMFYWNVSDDDNDSISLDLQLNSYGGCDFGSQDFGVGIDTRNYTLSYILKGFIEKGCYYNWSVRGYDFEEYGNYSLPYRRLNIQALVSINLLNDSVSFGPLMPDTIENTSDNIPPPFLIENEGNCVINVSLNATNLWNSSSNPSQYFQYKIDDYGSEVGSFNRTLSQVSWAYMPNVSNPYSAISFFNWSNTNDSAEIDIAIQVPPNEQAGNKISFVNFTARLAE